MDQLIPMLLTATVAAAAFATVAGATGVEAFRGEARPVVLFAPSRDTAAAAGQIRALTGARAALDEREMPVFVVTKTDVTTLSGGPAPATLGAGALRARFEVGDDAFALVLIGKDGEEKLRSNEPVAAEKLTGLVDEMPMRRREVR